MTGSSLSWHAFLALSFALLASAAGAGEYELKLGFEGREVEWRFTPGQQNGSTIPMPDPGDLRLQPPTPLPVPPLPVGAPPTVPLKANVGAAGSTVEHPNGFEQPANVLPVRIRDQFNPANNIPGSFGGATALAMVMEFHGLNLTDNQVADRIGVQSWGCNPDMISRAAEAFGFNSSYDNTPKTLLDLRGEVAANRPVIVNYTTPEFPNGHYAVVSGFTEDNKIVLLEPAHGVKRVMDVAEFERDWYSPVGKGLAVFVSPK